ncbi:13446_t:CDS:2, partial [Cetraspora pellucida]
MSAKKKKKSSREESQERSLSPLPSITDDTPSTTHISTSSNTSAPTKPLRANASYTNFFFEDDKVDNTIRYCKICVKELERSQQSPYPYTKSGGSTGNLTQHLRDKHNITTKNYKNYLDSEKKLTKYVVEFIVYDVQPLHILKCLPFRRMLLGFQPQYRIPCATSVKGYISNAYYTGIDQLQELLTKTAVIVHLTTDLWTAKSKYGYLGVTATWLTSDFKFREALLTCYHMPYPHDGESISNELYNIICEWNLDNKVCIITTNNGANIVKGIRLLDEQVKSIHRQLKSIQAFFHLPKQAQRLRESQMLINSANLSQDNETISPLETLAASLQNKSDAALRKEGEKLDQLYLTSEEK